MWIKFIRIKLNKNGGKEREKYAWETEKPEKDGVRVVDQTDRQTDRPARNDREKQRLPPDPSRPSTEKK